MWKVQHKGSVKKFETEHAAQVYVKNFFYSGARLLNGNQEPLPVQEKKRVAPAQPVPKQEEIKKSSNDTGEDKKPKRGRKKKTENDLPKRTK